MDRGCNGLAKYLDNIALRRMHIKFCNFVQSVYRWAIPIAVIGELGRFPVNFSCVIIALKYWCRHMEASNPLLQKTFSDSKNLLNNGVST